MSCPESLRVHAYFDSELDPPSAIETERHLENCADCRALLKDLERMRNGVRSDFGANRAPAALRERLNRTLVAESGGSAPAARGARAAIWRARPFWAGALTGVGGALAAAALAVLLWAPVSSAALLDTLVGEHVNSLLPGHLIAVESTDRHTVKPWFAGHADVSPLVEDFAAQGFPLIGGRADYLANQRAAVVVYQRGRHIINVFSWKNAARIPLRDTSRNGYHLAFWQSGDLQYCAVSDAGWDDLHTLERLLRALGTREALPRLPQSG
jgi:anti-sigma factor RsiW